MTTVSWRPPAAWRAGPPLPGEGDDAGRIVVYRDTWGVPHIYAATVEEGLYAQGWAQAQDRPEQLLLNLLMGIGEFSTALGEDGVDVDLRSRLFDHYGTARRGWDRARARAAGSPAGLRRRHERLLPRASRGRAGVVAGSRGRRPHDRRLRALLPLQLVDRRGLRRPPARRDRRLEFEPELRGSNQFAVAPGRSAEGAAILAIDPHLSWSGPSRFWEFRVHAGPWEGSGVGLPGFPYIGLGHTRHLAWAMTTGGPDTADVYELTLSPEPAGEPALPLRWRVAGADLAPGHPRGAGRGAPDGTPSGSLTTVR